MMWLDTLQMARDGATILLALEVFVLSLIPMLILYYITKWLRSFIPQVAPALRTAKQWIFRALAIIESIMAAVRAPFIWAQSANAALKAWVAGAKRLLGQGN